jgi:cell division protein YceG involved in septum cleavage
MWLFLKLILFVIVVLITIVLVWYFASLSDVQANPVASIETYMIEASSDYRVFSLTTTEDAIIQHDPMSYALYEKNQTTFGGYENLFYLKKDTPFILRVLQKGKGILYT